MSREMFAWRCLQLTKPTSAAKAVSLIVSMMAWLKTCPFEAVCSLLLVVAHEAAIDDVGAAGDVGGVV